ncbi:MAG: dockerin type I repeat-containing protein [Planctomycetota bacterium]|nr:dockerin type I repeat-containing protein [Planctomycetota bacterium]MDA1088667.1 dockerin type I repeat-containing protein [Verrucomicrobiota bacterium]
MGYQWSNNSSGSNQSGVETDSSFLPVWLQPLADPYDQPLFFTERASTSSHRVGIAALALSWIDVAQPVRFDVWHAVGPFKGAGKSIFELTRRLNVSPWTHDPSGQTTSILAERPDVVMTGYEWTDSQPGWVGFQCNAMINPNNVRPPANLSLLYCQATLPGQATGVSVGCRGKGGYTALDNYREFFPASDIPAWTDEGRRLFLEVFTHYSDGWLLVVQYLDVNDQSESDPSVHGITPGDSPEAYADNIRSTMAAYEEFAPDSSKVFHLLIGTPQLQESQNESIVELQEQLLLIAGDTPRTGFVGLQAIMGTRTELVANGIFPNQSDVHQTLHGSEVIGETVLDEIYTVLYDPPSPDINGDDAVNAADLALLLGDWGLADSPADLNLDGTVDAADLAMLLGAWTG